MKPFSRIPNPRDVRRRLGMNQQEFWSAIGVTQSGGSRYEGGRGMPRPVRELLRLVHIEGLDLRKVSRQDLEIIAHLKRNNPRVYESARKAAANGSTHRK